MLSSKNKFIYSISNHSHSLYHPVPADFYGHIYDVSVISKTWKVFTIRKINSHLTHSKCTRFYLFIDKCKFSTIIIFMMQFSIYALKQDNTLVFVFDLSSSFAHLLPRWWRIQGNVILNFTHVYQSIFIYSSNESFKISSTLLQKSVSILWNSMDRITVVFHTLFRHNVSTFLSQLFQITIKYHFILNLFDI